MTKEFYWRVPHLFGSHIFILLLIYRQYILNSIVKDKAKEEKRNQTEDNISEKDEEEKENNLENYEDNERNNEENKKDGVFYILYADFIKYFGEVFINYYEPHGSYVADNLFFDLKHGVVH